LKSVKVAGAHSVGIECASENKYIDNLYHPEEGDAATENGDMTLQFPGDSFGIWVAHGW